MNRTTTLPLGIDIGTARVRVALAVRYGDGPPTLLAVATRARTGDLGALLGEAIGELQTRERRCVFGVGEPDALLHTATFPPMGRAELERAARYEGSRAVAYPIDDAHVRVVPLDAGSRTIAIGIIRKDVVAELRAAAHDAKLRLLAIDDAGIALRRTLASADAVLDIGVERSLLYVFGSAIPRTHVIPIGGKAFTAAIVRAFGTDDLTAERRKLAHGVAGCGEDVADSLIERVAAALVDCRANGLGDVRSVALVGNGARLAGLAAGIERATSVRVEIATLAPDVSLTLPPDVLRAAAPDWCQAFGLSLWAAA